MNHDDLIRLNSINRFSSSTILSLSQTSNMSSPGQIFISGIVILANTRPVDRQKENRNIAFDVNFPVKGGTSE